MTRHVHCAICDSAGIVHPEVTYECFGFMYDATRAQNVTGVNFRIMKDLIFYPRKVSPTKVKVANLYLQGLKAMGIQSVLNIPVNFNCANIVHGVSFDLTKTSAQLGIGALELIRNIDYHYTFIKAVVNLTQEGASFPEALFLVRFFNIKGYQIYLPSADTTGTTLTDSTRGIVNLFDFTIKRKKFPLWGKDHTFSGVYMAYRHIKEARLAYLSIRSMSTSNASMLSSTLAVSSGKYKTNSKYNLPQSIFRALSAADRKKKELSIPEAVEMCNNLRSLGEFI